MAVASAAKNTDTTVRCIVVAIQTTYDYGDSPKICARRSIYFCNHIID